MMEEQRKSPRFPTIIDVTIKCHSDSYQAEVLDLSSTGVGLSWIQGNQSIPNDTLVQLEYFDPALGRQLSGIVKGCPPHLTYSPNVRSLGIKIDEACKDLVVQNLGGEFEIPNNNSSGFRRTWNTLMPEERIYMNEYFTKLDRSEDGEEKTVVGNLLNDDNSSGHRWRNFMKVLLRQVVTDKDKGVGSFDTLKQAFLTYKEQYSLLDAERDKPIHVDLTGCVASGS